MKEQWKDIKGYEGLYKVSNFGRVLSLHRQGNPKILTPKCNNSKRLWVSLYKCGVEKPMLIHRLVAQAFLDNPDNLPQINHIDENPQNNNIVNLEWCTQEYNIKYYCDRHPRKDGNIYYSEKYHKRNHLKIKQFSKDGIFVREWDNSRQIFLETGWSDWSISECCRGKRKSAYGFIWQYAN